MEKSCTEIEEILSEAGYPTDFIVIDFETYFDTGYTLSGDKGLSLIEYILDDRFELGGVGIYYSASDEAMFAPGEVGAEKVIDYLKVFGKNYEGITVIAQNCFFDLVVLVSS